MDPVSRWYEIDGFVSPGEYERFCAYLQGQVDAGIARQVPADPDYTRSEVSGGAWYQDRQTGEIWRLVPPDFPFRGLWEKVEGAETPGMDGSSV